VQNEIKQSIKKYLREKNQTFVYLQTIGMEFNMNFEKIGLQEYALRTHKAKY
jgi:hypothetical protein